MSEPAPERTPQDTIDDREIVEDGFGGRWVKHGPGCDLQVVRPGKVQCSCDPERTPSDDTTAPVTAEGLRERVAEKLWNQEQLVPWSRVFGNPDWRNDLEVHFERVDELLAEISPALDLLRTEAVETLTKVSFAVTDWRMGRFDDDFDALAAIEQIVAAAPDKEATDGN